MRGRIPHGLKPEPCLGQMLEIVDPIPKEKKRD
jgi:hypothetical protein